MLTSYFSSQGLKLRNKKKTYSELLYKVFWRNLQHVFAVSVYGIDDLCEHHILCVSAVHYVFVTGKGKVVPCHEDIWGGWYSFTILDLGTRWRWVVSFTTWPLYPRGNYPQYPLDRRLNGPQRQSGRCGKEKNLALPGIKLGRSSP
jgi:hypothetical protein